MEPLSIMYLLSNCNVLCGSSFSNHAPVSSESKYTILVHLTIFNTVEKLKVYDGNDQSNCNIT